MVTVENFKYEGVLGLKFGYSPIGRPKMFVHIYFVDGLLIDTGQRNARRKILDTTNTLNIEKVLVTHHHEDHSGNIGAIAERHGCPVYASEACAQLMKAPPPLSLPQKLSWGSRKAYADIISVGNEIKTKNHRFTVIPIPGHAPDMVALYEADKKWLFPADLYINSYIGYFLKSESIAEQIASTKRILQLDFKVLVCCHNPQMTQAKAQLSKKLDFLESSFEDVAQWYGKGYGAQEIFRALKLKENRLVNTLSGGLLSKMNMVKSIIRDIEGQQTD